MAGKRAGAAADRPGAAPVYQVRSAQHRRSSAAAAGVSGCAVDFRVPEPGGGDGIESTRRIAAGDAGDPGAGLSEFRHFAGGRHGRRRICRAGSRHHRGNGRAPRGRRAGKAGGVPAIAGDRMGRCAAALRPRLTPEDMERLKQVATLDAKHPKRRFESDTEAKKREAGGRYADAGRAVDRAALREAGGDPAAAGTRIRHVPATGARQPGAARTPERPGARGFHGGGARRGVAGGHPAATIRCRERAVAEARTKGSRGCCRRWNSPAGLRCTRISRAGSSCWIGAARGGDGSRSPFSATRSTR